jgi:hypothetical protein
MTADRVIVLVAMVAGFVVVTVFNRRKLARMNPEERAQFDRNIAPVARFLKAFMWFWVVVCIAAGVLAAVDGVWPISVALLVLAVGLGFGVAHHSRWWIGS